MFNPKNNVFLFGALNPCKRPRMKESNSSYFNKNMGICILFWRIIVENIIEEDIFDSSFWETTEKKNDSTLEKAC